MSNENLNNYYTTKRICAYFNQQQTISLVNLLNEHLIEQLGRQRLFNFLIWLQKEFPFLECIEEDKFRLLEGNKGCKAAFIFRFQLDEKQTIKKLEFQFDDILLQEYLEQQLMVV